MIYQVKFINMIIFFHTLLHEMKFGWFFFFLQIHEAMDIGIFFLKRYCVHNVNNHQLYKFLSMKFIFS